MMQIVVGSTLGVLLAEALLQGTKLVFVSARRDALRARIRTLFSLQESGLIDGFVKYAGAVALVAALTVLGGWSLADYLAAKPSSGAARNNDIEPSAVVPLPEPVAPAKSPSPLDSPSTAQPVSNPTTAPEAVGLVDPYTDSEFQVRRRVRRSGTSSLKEAYLQRDEDKARAALLRQVQDRGQRSQYDCEAAVHAARYLKAGLDVWGFTAWQAKYFPTDRYKGASMAECRSIKEVLDPKRINVKSAVADRGNM